MRLSAVSSAQDAELVANLAERCWRPHYTPIIGAAQVNYMLAKFQSTSAILEQIADGRVYHIIEDEQAIGYLATDHGEHLFLSKLYILPEHHGRGAGRWALEALAAAHPELEIHLTVNKHNHDTIAFYKKMGFVKNGPLVTEIGEGFVMDDWKMKRPSGSILG